MKMQSRNKSEIIKMINPVNESNRTKHLLSSDTKRNLYNIVGMVHMVYIPIWSIYLHRYGTYVWLFNFKNYC